MSILNYFKAPDPQADDDPSTDSSPDAGEAQSGEMSSCSSSLPEVSDSEEDPSLPLVILLDSHVSTMDCTFILWLYIFCGCTFVIKFCH